MALNTIPEPMNASPHHSKVRVSLTMSDSMYVARGAITGKMEVECRADKGLGLGVMMVELFAIEELTSRDHSATSTFIRSKRVFQGQGLPPSNAVVPHPVPGDPPLPAHYHQARRGQTTYLFRFPLPASSPSAINFGSGLARVRYEVRASVGVAWKGERRLVTDKRDVDVVESFDDDSGRAPPEAVVVGEGGKVWAQGRVLGGVVVAGQGACVELQVKNHSPKKNSSLSVSLARHLHLSGVPGSEKSPLQISDTLTNVSFKGPEYVAQPGTEGIANLVFDIPKDARSVKGGLREDEEEGGRTTEGLFEVRCIVGIKIAMGLGSKDIYMELPVTILHPNALPPAPVFDPYASPPLHPYAVHDRAVSPIPMPSPMPVDPYGDRTRSPYAYPLPMSPSPPPFLQYNPDNPAWYPPHPSQTPVPYPYLASQPVDQQYFYPPPPVLSPINATNTPYRPSSTEPVASQHIYALPSLPSGLPAAQASPLLQSAEPEEGKGERSARVSQHLRMSSRHRSVSPPSHRFPLPVPSSSHQPLPGPGTSPQDENHLSLTKLSTSPGEILSPRPMPSPKHTVTVDPFTLLSLTKSERVDALEKMAAEVDSQSKDMSADIPKSVVDGRTTELDKTLPGPPVPTGKEKRLSAHRSSRPRVDAVFSALSAQVASPSDETPPTPTLLALSPGKFSNDVLTQPRSGLDALEQRLLEQVGTRKPEEVKDKRIDVRAVLPITIPPRPSDGDALNDSAISSLTLSGHGEVFEGPTHQPHPLSGRTDRSGDERDTERERDQSVRASREKDVGKERRSGKKKDRVGSGKDVEAFKLRKAAKGRVAEWLGRIDPEIPPPVDTPPPSTPTPDLIPPSDSLSAGASATVSEHNPKTPDENSQRINGHSRELNNGSHTKNESPRIDEPESLQDAVNASPNPRSSGFMPIGTYRASLLQFQAANPSSSFTDKTITPLDVSQGAAAEPLVTGTVSPSMAPSRKPRALSPKLPVYWPPSSDPGTKYDVRSARGGKGGKVAAITALWASAVQGSGVKTNPSTVPDSPKPKRVEVPVSKPVPVSSADMKVKFELPKAKRDKSPGRIATDPELRPAIINRMDNMASSRPVVSKKPPSPIGDPPSLGDLTARRARMVKSASVPAMLSSSLAKPTLSSTASLVKPPISNKVKATKHVLPTVIESTTSSEQKAPAKAPGEMAFGQARLRDLIKKYQGQANS